jgi:primosomal protein N' (replication factor Y) (superfamily II helicase)
MKTVEVVFDIPLDKTFDYLPGVFLDKISTGVRVRVPFGRQKKTGLVLSTREKDVITEDYKGILKVYDGFPLITDELFSVAGYMTERYFSSLGQSVFSMLGGLPLRYKTDELYRVHSTNINSSVMGGGFQKEFILFRSEYKKMEMYKEIISSVPDGSVLFLSSEVSTSEGYYEWMSKLYGDRVVLFHGGLKNKEKLNNWLRILTGRNLVVVGTRLAVFSPLSDLKTIIIDEGQDSSYKEQQTPKYDALEISEFRCKNLQIPLIIGERCLSVREYFDIKNTSAVLKTTDGDALPNVYTFMMGKTYADKNIPFFSRESVSMIEETVLKGEKVAVIHNRKGSSKVLKCEKCGNRFLCNTCGSPMVLTEDGKNLVCRFCKTVTPFNNRCPICGSRKIGMKLYGIEKMFRTLKEQYPDMRISKFTGDTGEVNGEFDILVGTGIIKRLLGTHFFSLIVFVSGESFLNIPDYRGEEHFFTLVNEIRRILENRNCKILIQTRNPNLELYKSLRENNPEIFYEKELSIRKNLGYPPFNEIVKVELRGRQKDVLERRKEMVESYLKEKKIEVIYAGPSFPPVKKGKDVWKYLLRISSGFDRKEFRKISQEIGVTVESNPD